MKWTIINYPDKLCMEWNVRMEYRHEFFIYMTFLFITINGRFKIELQHLPPWWGLQEASSSPCPEQGLWPYQAPQKVHREDHGQAVVFPNPKKIYKSTAVLPNPKENRGLHCPSPGLKARCRVPRRCGDFGGFCFSRRGTEGRLCGGTPAVLHLGALHLMSKQYTNCFSSQSWSTVQSSVEFGCL